MKTTALFFRLIPVLWLTSSNVLAESDYVFNGQDAASTAKIGQQILKSRRQVAVKGDLSTFESEILAIQQIAAEANEQFITMSANVDGQETLDESTREKIRRRLPSINAKLTSLKQDLPEEDGFITALAWLGFESADANGSAVSHGATRTGIEKFEQFRDQLELLANENPVAGRDKLIKLLKDHEITKQSAIPADVSVNQETFESVSISYEMKELEK